MISVRFAFVPEYKSTDQSRPRKTIVNVPMEEVEKCMDSLR